VKTGFRIGEADGGKARGDGHIDKSLRTHDFALDVGWLRDPPILAEGATHRAVPKAHRKSSGAWKELPERLFLYGIKRDRRNRSIKGKADLPVYVHPGAAFARFALAKRTGMRTEAALDTPVSEVQEIFPLTHGCPSDVSLRSTLFSP